MADHAAPLLITGASRGIGEATARLFAQMGHRVALLARSVAAIESLADEIGGLATPCDVANEVAVRQAVHKSATEFGGIGIVINNAGALAPAARILDTDPKDWTRRGQSFWSALRVAPRRASVAKGWRGHQRVLGRSSESPRGLERLLCL